MTQVLTKGWDLIAAITQQSLNSILPVAFNKSSIPTEISEVLDLGILGTVQVDVTIDAPTVDLSPDQSSGDSSFTGIKFPITGGTVSANGNSEDVPPGTLEVVTNLKYVEVDFTNGTSGNNKVVQLSLDFDSDLAFYNVIFDDPGYGDDIITFIEEGLTRFLQNLPDGSINLGQVNFPAKISALAPVGEADFAVQKANDPDQNTLMLLMMTESGTRPTDPNATNFSSVPPFLSAGKQSALYMSNRLLIEEIITPQLSNSLGIAESSWVTTGDQTTPYIASFEGDAPIGNEYDMTLESLSASVNESQQVQASYTVDAKPVDLGSIYYIEVKGDIFVAIDCNGNTISFQTTSDDGSGSIHCPLWAWAIVIAAIIATGGTLSIGIAMLVAIVVPIVVNLISFPVTLPDSLNTEINDALGSFTWPAQQLLSLESIQLPGDLVIYCEPVIQDK